MQRGEVVLRLQNKTDNIEELYSEKCEREKTKSDKSNYTPKSRVIMNTHEFVPVIG